MKNKCICEAIAMLSGGDNLPELCGCVRFIRRSSGVLVRAEVSGLPNKGCGDSQIFGFHIHEGNSCGGSMDDPFSCTEAHYNPDKTEHPLHRGDMPPLFGNNGYAFALFYTERFSIDEIIGKTVVIHDSADDFKSQPSGNSGKKIACGVIHMPSFFRK